MLYQGCAGRRICVEWDGYVGVLLGMGLGFVGGWGWVLVWVRDELNGSSKQHEVLCKTS